MRPSNLHFNSYVDRLSAKTQFKETSNFFLRALQAIPRLIWDIIKDALIEILFLVILVLMITEMSQGRDLIITFFEPKGLYGLTRMLLSTLSIVLYSSCMWVVPAFIFEWKDRRNASQPDEESLYDRHLYFAHRMLAMIPFWAFAYCVQPKHDYRTFGIFIGLAIVQLLALTVIILFFEKRIKLFILLAGIVVAICCTLIIVNHKTSYLLVKQVYMVGLFALSIVLYLFYALRDNEITTENLEVKTKGSIFKKHLSNTRIYFVIAGITLVSLFVCICYLDLRAVVPESLILLVFSGYVLLIDLIHYLVQFGKLSRFIFGCLVIAIVVLFISGRLPNTRYLEIRYKKDSDHHCGKDLAGIEEYYNKWKDRIIHRQGNAPYDIVLVAGEGGGSRAGYWLAQGLIEMDVTTQGRFQDHIFSLSTVSGSSVGLGTMMSYWTYCKENNISVNSSWLDLPRRVFRYNYVGGNLSGVLVTDLISSLAPWCADGNRNDEQQKEEARCIQQGLIEIRQGLPDAQVRFWHKPDTLDDDKLILRRDFMQFYYNNDRSGQYKIDTSLPLCFINTTRSSDGRRGIFSPIRLASNDFKDALDITRFIYTDSFRADGIKPTTYPGRHRQIALGTACNTSEIFPLFSAPALIDSLGYFLDGGYNDNSGLKTTLEVRDKLISLLQADSAIISPKDYRITVLYFKNSVFEKKYYPGKIDRSSPGLQPFIALTKEPFTGGASYFEEQARITLDSNFIRYQLNYGNLLDTNNSRLDLPDSVMPLKVQKEILEDIYTVKTNVNTKDTTLNFPLARWLSYFIIEKMKVYSAKEFAYERGLPSLINRIQKE